MSLFGAIIHKTLIISLTVDVFALSAASKIIALLTQNLLFMHIINIIENLRKGIRHKNEVFYFPDYYFCGH